MLFIKWLINILFWLQAFAAPVILFGLIALATASSERMAIVLLGIGGVVGIVLAEYIRRKIGLDTFFGRIYGPNEMDKKGN
ncbi:MAG: hypothetical protein ABL876_19440 [Chitinophagaceae bacterium]